MRLQTVELLLEVEQGTAEDLRAHGCQVPNAVQCRINVLRRLIRQSQKEPVEPSTSFTPPGEYGT